MWQGNATTDFRAKLATFAAAGYKVMVVETAGYYRTAAGDLPWPYAFTQAGQLQFMEDLRSTARANSSTIGLGYWGSCWTQTAKWSPDVTRWTKSPAARCSITMRRAATMGISGWQ